MIEQQKTELRILEEQECEQDPLIPSPPKSPSPKEVKSPSKLPEIPPNKILPQKGKKRRPPNRERKLPGTPPRGIRVWGVAGKPVQERMDDLKF